MIFARTSFAFAAIFRRMRALRLAVALLASVGAAGCFPDYEVGGGTGGNGGGPVYIGVTGATFEDDLGSDQFRVRFTHAFQVDQYEVTVQRYRNWLDSGGQPPCESGTCSLDPGGPYETTMIWDSAWNSYATELHFDTDNPAGTCTAPSPYAPPTTWAVGAPQNNDYPMTCVSWFQAAAFCFWEGNRLLTQAEWMYVATSSGKRKTDYPWGNEPPTCSRATIAGCGFPKDVGVDTYEGRTLDGVQDLAGGVYEWVWDVSWISGSPPLDVENYTGPAPSGAPATVQRARRGGAFINDASADDLRNGFGEPFPAGEFYADAGFRCARSDK